MDRILEVIVLVFKVSRIETEMALERGRERMKDHRHGPLCFKWRFCRRIEGAAPKMAKLIAEYEKIEAGLSEGNYDEAINFLVKSGASKETSWQIEIRAAKALLTIEKILDRAVSDIARKELMRDYLVKLRSREKKQA